MKLLSRSLLGVAILVLSVGGLAVAALASLPAPPDPLVFLRIIPFVAPLILATVVLAPLVEQIRASSVVAFARTRAFRERILQREPEILLT